MDDAYRDTRRVLLEARNQLETLEAACANAQLDPQASAVVATAFRHNLARLTDHSARLRTLVPAQAATTTTRRMWDARVKDLDDQIGELRAGDARCTRRFRCIRSDYMLRDELFQRRGAGVGHMGQTGQTGQTGDAVLRLGMVEEKRALKQSGTMLSGVVNTGASTLEQLIAQRGRLNKVKNNVVGVMKQVGVDGRLIASIERRQFSDTVVLYSLMVVMVLLLALAVLYKYQRHKHSG
ncbi:unnamed protein product [Agarophyton chilense]